MIGWLQRRRAARARRARLWVILRKLVEEPNTYVDCVHEQGERPQDCLACEARALLRGEDAA